MPRKRKTGRPRLKIDHRQVLELARLHCTLKEIAAVCGCSPDVLQRRFAVVVARGKEEGKERLRRAQWRSAEGYDVELVNDKGQTYTHHVPGSYNMQIWLGKQYLEQHEPQPDLAAVATAMEGQTEALRKVMLAARGSIPLAPPPTVTATVSVQPATPAATPAQ